LNYGLIKNIVQEASLIVDIGENFDQTFIDYKSINPNAVVLSIKEPTSKLDERSGFQTFDFINIDAHFSEISIINGAANTLLRTKWLLIKLPVLEKNSISSSPENIINRLYEIGFITKQIIENNKFKDVFLINTKYDQDTLNDDSPRKTLGVKYDLLLWAYEKIKPQYFIEVGTYKCQTSVGLFKAHLPSRAYLIDIFEKAPVEELPPEEAPFTSDQALELIQKNFGNEFDCGIVIGNSIDSLPIVVEAINSFEPGSTFIFVDGGHSYDTAVADLMNASLIKHDVYVAIDDANFSGVSAAIQDFIKAVRDRNPQVLVARPNLVIFKLESIK